MSLTLTAALYNVHDMPSTGLFFLSIPPNQPSPSSTLISHVSRSFPAEPLSTFYLDHRLFVDTSSLLPNADVSQRKFTSILTLSHNPTKAFIGTSATKKKGQSTEQPGATTLITIPSSSADTFTQLIGTKLQPQWAHRQSLVLENGAALSLQNGKWTVRIGDLKTPSRSSQPVSNLRGMLLEISYDVQNPASNGMRTQGANDNGEAVSQDAETLIRGVVESLIDGTGVNMENSLVLFRSTKGEHEARGSSDGVDWELAKLYMDVLRGSRG